MSNTSDNIAPELTQEQKENYIGTSWGMWQTMKNGDILGKEKSSDNLDIDKEIMNLADEVFDMEGLDEVVVTRAKLEEFVKSSSIMLVVYQQTEMMSMVSDTLKKEVQEDE